MGSWQLTRFLIANVIAILSLATFARAEITIERVPLDDGPPALVLKGEFSTNDDPSVFAREVGATGAKIVSFSSGGGNIISAMAYGRMIRSLGLSTMQARSMECSSACALAFVGGINRHAEPGAIGVHQSSFAPEHTLDGQSAVAAVQRVTAHIITYLVEMGIDPRLLQLSLSVPSTDMRYLTATEMQDFKVTTSGEATAASTPSVATTPQPDQPTSVAETTPQNDTREDRARAFLTSYYETWSQSNSQSMNFAESAYADFVTFYDKVQAKSFIVDEKRKFVERWPERAYSPKADTVKVICTDNCQIIGVVEWFARSFSGKTSSGDAEFAFGWDPRTNRIVSESGKVITLDKNVFEPTRIISQWHTENQLCRGGSGDSPETHKACGRRDKLDAKLASVGWCYGRPGEYGYQMNWHQCEGRQSSASNSVQANATRVSAPDPRAYPVEARFSGKTKMPDFKGRDKDFNSFRTRIRNGLKGGPNFAGHYSLIQFGCGTGCSAVIVSDSNTGRPMGFPRGGEDNMYLSLMFRRDSRLIAAQWADTERDKCVIEFFDFKGRAWKPLNRYDVGAVDACYREIGQNLQ
ncbi:hypothetical protein U2P60_06155 [Brucella sp. H1_1004]|uniref:COG3904 family protein n=1 Tax=Brucella sp. H1_1004 TaxID=3110109 RepID=UPI0039B47CC1